MVIRRTLHARHLKRFQRGIVITQAATLPIMSDEPSESTVPTTSIEDAAKSDPDLQSRTIILATPTGTHPVTLPPANLAERRYASARIRKPPPSKEYPGHDHPDGINAAPQHLVRAPKRVEPVVSEKSNVVPVTEAPKAKKARVEKCVKKIAKKSTKKVKVSSKVVKKNGIKKTRKLKLRHDRRESSPLPSEPEEPIEMDVEPIENPSPVSEHLSDYAYDTSEGEDEEDEDDDDCDSVPPATIPIYRPFPQPIPRHWEILPCIDFDLADVLALHPGLEASAEPVQPENPECLLQRKIFWTDDIHDTFPRLPLQNPAPYSNYLTTSNARAEFICTENPHDRRLSFYQLERHLQLTFPEVRLFKAIYFLEFFKEQARILDFDCLIKQYLQSRDLAKIFVGSIDRSVETVYSDLLDVVFHIGNRLLISTCLTFMRFVHSIKPEIFSALKRHCIAFTIDQLKFIRTLPIIDPYINLIDRCPLIMSTKLPELIVVVRIGSKEKKLLTDADLDYSDLTDPFLRFRKHIQLYFNRKGYDTREITLSYNCRHPRDIEFLDAFLYLLRTLNKCLENWHAVTVITFGAGGAIMRKALTKVNGINALININVDMESENVMEKPNLSVLPQAPHIYCPTMFVVSEKSLKASLYSEFITYTNKLRKTTVNGFGFFGAGDADAYLNVAEATLLQCGITQAVVDRLILDYIHMFLIRKSRNAQWFLTANEPAKSPAQSRDTDAARA